MKLHDTRTARGRILRNALLVGGALALIALLALASCSGGLKALSDGAQYIAKQGSGVGPPWGMFGMNSLHVRRSTHTGPATNRLRWKHSTTGDIYLGSPAVAADGTIYIGDEGSATSTPKLYAVNANGTLKWTYATIGAVDPPAISADGSTVYVGAGYDYTYQNIVDTKIYAISSSGSLRWTYDAGGLVESAAVIGADGTVYAGSRAGVSQTGKLHALNPDGTVKPGWPFTTSGRIQRSSPAIGSDGTLYVGTVFYDGISSSGMFYAINPDGTEKWEYAMGGQVTSSPAIGADGTVYVGSADQLDNPDNSLYAFNPDGSLKWRYVTDKPVYSSPAIGADGTVYVGSYAAGADGSGRLYAINPDGTLRWTYVWGPWAAGIGMYSSPAIGADGTVYVAASNGDFLAINASGTLKWSYRLGTGTSYSSPAIGSDGTVYIGGNAGPALKEKGKWVPQPGGLYAFGPGLN